MKSKTFFKTLLAMLVTVFVLTLGLAAAACNPEEGEGGGNGGNPGGTVVEPLPEGPETGVWYFNANGEEYLLTLHGGNLFMLTMNGESKSGLYKLENNVLTLSFYDEEEGEATADYEESALTLTYHNSQMRFLKKIKYTLTFNSQGGSAVNPVKVDNGQTAAQPTDPTRAGHVFVGWFEDEAGSKPFLFDSTPITGDLTVYAKWAATVPGQEEYKIDFNLGYNAEETPASRTTVGGQLISLPEPGAREDFTFGGWWISMYDNIARLSYQYKDGMVFAEDTTLFAMWNPALQGGKLAAPVVSVSNTNISWGAVDDAVVYSVEVQGPNGFSKSNSAFGGTTYNEVNFSALPEGDYVIRVTAVAAAPENNSEATVLYYKNKALARVSHFQVVAPATLLFNGVENAEEYFITVECGNSRHNHQMLSNGNSTHFNFVNCPMAQDGIKFTVTAVAAGYASSESREFVYNRLLGEVTEISVNDDQTLVWKAVPFATSYLVTVTCGDGEHSLYVSGNSLSLKECAPAEGGITVEITPVTKGYNSPAPATYIYDKKTIASPANIRIDGTTVLWDDVDGAVSYEVKIGDVVLPAEGTSLELAEALRWSNTDDYTLSVRAIAEDTSKNSLYSDPLDIRYYSMSASLSYSANVLSWHHVVGATGYEVQVNEGEIIPVTGGVNYVEIALTQSGNNTLKVRYLYEEGHSEWAETVVYAHTVNFDTMGGAPVDSLYVAVGDKTDLESTTRDGYNFVGWAYAPVGNVAMYDDEYFAGNSDVTLFAQWDNAIFDITLEYNIYNREPGTAQVVYRQPFKLEAPVHDDPVYTFLGWFSAADGGVQYTDTQGNSLMPWPIAGTATVYAHWDVVLNFTKLSNGTWSVTQGPGIEVVDTVTVPAEYNGYKVTVVDGYAFRNCSNLKTVNIPDTITLIDTGTAFAGCSGLQNITIYDAYEGDDETLEKLYESSDGALIYHNPQTGLVDLAFFPAAKTGDYVIPEGVTNLPLSVFAGRKLSSVTIPTTVTSIEQTAFADCEYLVTVTFIDGEDSSVVIADRAFASCSSLETVNLPSGFTLGEEVTFAGVFRDCKHLTAVNVAEGHAQYSSLEGMVTDVNEVTLIYCPLGVNGVFSVPDGITTIEANVFEAHDLITEVNIPGTVLKIGEYAFANSNFITKVTFKASIEGMTLEIGAYAFYSDDLLAEVVFEEDSHVAKIGSFAFAASGLAAIELPATLTNIDDHAFSGDSYLKQVTFAANGEELTIADYAFNNCTGLKSMALPANVVSLTSTVFAGCENIDTMTVDPTNPNFVAVENVLYNTGYTQILFYPAHKEGPFSFPDEVQIVSEGVFEDNLNLTEIIIGANITAIQDNAFLNASNLVKVTFADTPEGQEAKTLTIGANAFMGTHITGELKLPERLTTIGDYAFAGRTNVAQNADNNITKVNIPGTVTSIGQGAFRVNKDLNELTFDEGTAELTIAQATSSINGAFYGTSIGAVEIPARMTVLGAYAFSIQSSTYSGTTSTLKTLTFAPNSKLTEIGNYAFYHGGFESVTIPASVTKIGAGAFSQCLLLNKVEFETSDKPLEFVNPEPTSAGLYTSSAGVFSGDALLSTIQLPSRATNINAHMFYRCNALQTITIPASIREIGQGAFLECANLSEVTFEELKLTDVKEAEEEGAANPNDLIIADGSSPDNTISASEGVFQGCTSLQNITLPARLAKLGKAAFADCTKLESITFNDAESAEGIYEASGLELGFREFKDTKITTLNFPARLSLVRNLTFAGAPIETVTIKEKNVEGQLVNKYVVVDGIVYDGPKTEVIYCPTTITGSITIPGTVTKVNNQAFWRCVDLESVTFEEGAEDRELVFEDGHYNGGNTAGVEEQRYGVFYGCTSLTTVKLPKGLTKIGEYSFFECTSLQSINIPNTVTFIAKAAFANCSALATLTFDEGGTADLQIGSSSFSGNLSHGVFCGTTMLKNIVFPERLSYVGKYAFQSAANEKGQGYNGLESITFPDNCRLSSIGESAFRYTKITTLKLPAALVSLDKSVFADTKLTEVTFEEGSKLTALPGNTFSNTKLTTITIPATVTTIAKGSLTNTLQSITFETRDFEDDDVGAISKLTALPADMFSGFSKLTNVTLAEGLTTINNSVFNGCKLLEEIKLPSTVTTLGDSVFNGCTGLKNITIPASVTKMGKSVFQGCTELQTATFEKDCPLDALGATVFSGCSKLQSVVLPDGLINLANITSTAFTGCSKLTSLTLSSKLRDVSGLEKVTTLTALTEVKIDEGNVNFTSYNGVLYNKNKTEVAYLPLGLSAYTVIEGVTSIGKLAFSGNGKLTQIEIPASVISIGDSAFSGCKVLQTVTFAVGTDKLTIGASAFDGCVKLNNVTLPDRLASLGAGVFNGCTGMEQVTFDKGVNITAIPEKAFSGCNKLKSIEVPNTVTTIGESAFQNCSKLTAATLSTALNSLGASAFSGCALLGEITIPTGVTVIENSTFSGCAALLTVNLSDKLQTIGDSAFNGCKLLAKLTMANEVTSIGASAFAGCTALGSVQLSTTLASIGESAFSGCTTLNNVVIPGSVKSIDKNAFSGCTGLETLTLSEGLLTLGDSVFQGCNKLSAVNLPGTVTTVGANAFSGCTNLGTFTFANGSAELTFADSGTSMTSATSGTFYNCTSLQNIALPARLVKLGSNMFVGCSGLKSVTFAQDIKLTQIPNLAFLNCKLLDNVILPAGTTSIGSRAFEGTAITKMNIPANVTSVGTAAFNKTTALASFTIEGGDVPLAFASTGANATYPMFGGSGITAMQLPARVTEIGAYMFYKATQLTQLTLTEDSTLDKIGNYAFSGCSRLASFNFPATLTSIGTNAFEDCSLLESANIPAGVTALPVSVFANCVMLTNVTLNKGLETIDKNAFSKCIGLEQITIPNTVTLIKEGAFNGCVALTTFTFEENGENALVIDAASKTTAVLGGTGVSVLNLPERLTTIGLYAFYNMTKLTEVYIPSTVTQISAGAFANCTALETLTFAEDGEETLTISDGGTHDASKTGNLGAFALTSSLGAVSFPARLKVIGDYAFSYSGITAVTIPKTVTQINSAAFNACTRLKTLYFESGRTEGLALEAGSAASSTYGNTGTGVFAGCTALTQVILPGSIGRLYSSKYDNQLATYSFAYCTNLEEILFADVNENSLTAMQTGAFMQCTNLKSVDLSGLTNFTELASNVFQDCPKAEIKLPASFAKLGSGALAGVYSIELTGESEDFSVGDDGVLYNADKTSIVVVPNCVTGEFTIPEEVTTVESYAFAYNVGVDTLRVTPQVTKFSSYAFRSATGLKKVYITDLEAWCQISMSTDSNPLIAAEELYLNDVLVEDLTIEGFENVAAYAFNGYKGLKTVTIGDGVKTLGNYVFRDCSNLTTITFGKDVETLGIYFCNGCTSLTQAIFKNPKNWCVATSATGTGKTALEDIGDPAKAATYLKTTHSTNKYWSCVW